MSRTHQELIELLGTEHILCHHELWDWANKEQRPDTRHTTASLKQALGAPGTLVIVYDESASGDGPDGMWTMPLLHIGKMNVLHDGKTWHIKRYE
jgi:hypothetical protein